MSDIKRPMRLLYSDEYNVDFESFVLALEHLQTLFDDKSRPEVYGQGFGYIECTCVFGNKSDEGFAKPRLQVSRISKKSDDFRVLATRYFEKDFTTLSLAEQKQEFEEDIFVVLSKVAQKISRKGLEYKSAVLIHDAKRVLTLWQNASR